MLKICILFLPPEVTQEETSERKDDLDINNELKEFVKQRYARRYRSKFPRRKSSNLIDEVILEEDESELAEAELDNPKPILKLTTSKSGAFL